MNSDKIIPLALSMYHKKGAYALFLGSGVSRAAGIPTGWEIVKDLTRKVAALKGEKNVTDSIQWYKENYSQEPDYSDIMGELAHTPQERQNLLKDYFEPGESDSEDNLKEPTAAHRAIAGLVKDGYIRVILTTNFDHLLEKALAEVGIQTKPITCENDIKGAEPLTHASFTLVKINGDYLDCRFRNTFAELDNYPDDWAKYLSRIFKDFGLITCGWSAQWDKALVNLIAEHKTPTYSAFFAAPYESNTETLKALSQKVNGTLIHIDDADTFFTQLQSNIQALIDLTKNTPLSTELVVSKAKRYIPDPQAVIKLYDMAEEISADTIRLLNARNAVISVPSRDLVNEMAEHSKTSTQTLRAFLSVMIQWGKTPEQIEIITRSLKNVFNRKIPKEDKGQPHYANTEELNHIGSAYLLYYCGTQCLRYSRFDLLRKILTIPVKIHNYDTDPKKAFEVFNTCLYFDSQVFGKNQHSLIFALKELLCPQEEDKEMLFQFCLFEKMIDLFFAIYCKDEYLPQGFYCLMTRGWTYKSIEQQMENYFSDIDTLKEGHETIRQGLFDSYSQYAQAKADVDKFNTENPLRL